MDHPPHIATVSFGSPPLHPKTSGLRPGCDGRCANTSPGAGGASALAGAPVSSFLFLSPAFSAVNAAELARARRAKIAGISAFPRGESSACCSTSGGSSKGECIASAITASATRSCGFASSLCGREGGVKRKKVVRTTAANLSKEREKRDHHAPALLCIVVIPKWPLWRLVAACVVQSSR